MDAEKAFDVVGNLGRYQIVICGIMFMANFIYSPQMVLMVIVGATPNTSIPSEKNLTTIVTEFDLYGKDWITDLMQSLMMAGYMVGAVVFGQASDLLGRKKVFLFCGIFLAISAFCSGLATCWQTFAVARFFTGLFTGGGGVALYVLLTELVGRKMWTSIGLLFQVCFAFGVMFLAGLAFAVQRWRTICMVAGGMGFVLLPLVLFLVPESPRWLYVTGKTEEAEKVFRLLARKNGKPCPDLRLSPVNPQITSKNHTILDMFRYKKLVIWIFAICMIWFTTSLAYYGLTMSAADFTSNLYLGVVLTGAVEVPAILTCIFLMDFKWLGRKRTVIMLLLLTCAASVATIFVSVHAATARLVLGLTSKLASSGIFSVIYVYTTEIFPTPLRTIALGWSSTIARVGAILASFVPLLLTHMPFMPFVIFGATTFLSALLALLLPVTLGKPVPQTVEEVVNPAYQQLTAEQEADFINDLGHSSQGGVNA